MAGRGNPFSRDYSTGNSSESILFPNPAPKEKGKELLYPVDNEVVDDLRIITRDYVKKIGGLPIIPVLLLQLQHLPKIQKNLGPPFYFVLLSSLVLFDFCSRFVFMLAMFHGLY